MFALQITHAHKFQLSVLHESLLNYHPILQRFFFSVSQPPERCGNLLHEFIQPIEIPFLKITNLIRVKNCSKLVETGTRQKWYVNVR